MASLRTEYAVALDEKRNACAEYRKAKAHMRELLTARTSVDSVLNIQGHDRERDADRTDL
jgi:hypothetical protein